MRLTIATPRQSASIIIGAGKGQSTAVTPFHDPKRPGTKHQAQSAVNGNLKQRINAQMLAVQISSGHLVVGNNCPLSLFAMTAFGKRELPLRVN
jgi:hypothetical protein